jgi:PAS domain S-box-containing protein
MPKPSMAPGAEIHSPNEGERLFRLFAEQIPQAVWMRRHGQDTYEYVSPRMGGVVGRPVLAGEKVASTLECVHPDDRDRVAAEMQRLPDGGMDIEVRLLRQDGTQRYGHVRTFPIAGADGAVEWIGGILEDITERHQARAQLESANRRLQYLSERVLAVQEEERRVLSGELHDDVGQSLLALQIGLHRLGQSPVQAQPQLLAECAGIVAAVQDKLREVSVRLHPPQLTQLGVLDALRALVSRQRAVTGMDIRCAFEGPDREDLTPAGEIACYRICQEALSNATRHARAGQIEVRTKRERDRFCLSVRDDGAGFDADLRREAVGASGHLGLISMEERARLAGGELELRTAPGAGTVVIAKFPRSSPAGAPTAGA